MDSEVLTIAVNFWWPSMTISGMLEHMDAYYLRRILKRYVLCPLSPRMIRFIFGSSVLLQRTID